MLKHGQVRQLFGSVVILCLFCGFYCDDSPLIQPQKLPKTLWNSTYTDKLRVDLLKYYDKFSRPSDPKNATTVQFGLSVQHLEVDELKSTVTLYCWTRLLWDDNKLKWNSSEYGGLQIIKVADHEIWQPDVHLYNSIVTSISSSVPILVYASGSVVWVPPSTYSFLCNFDLTYWPFDTQTCKMKFASWTHHGDELNITVFGNENSAVWLSDVLVHNTEWKILSALAERHQESGQPYPGITCTIVLQRTSPSYTAILITPSVVIIFLTLVTFWLPPQAGEKLILHSCVSAVICIFLLYFAKKIPAMCSNTPLIVLFYSNSLYLTTFATGSAVIVLLVSRTQHSRTIPWVIKKHLTGTFGRFLLLSIFSTKNSDHAERVIIEEVGDRQTTLFDDHNNVDEYQVEKSLRKSHIQEDWILLAVAVDRMCFIIYCFVFGILCIIYSI